MTLCQMFFASESLHLRHHTWYHLSHGESPMGAAVGCRSPDKARRAAQFIARSRTPTGEGGSGNLLAVAVRRAEFPGLCRSSSRESR